MIPYVSNLLVCGPGWQPGLQQASASLARRQACVKERMDYPPAPGFDLREVTSQPMYQFTGRVHP
jgi:hypothetical protein